MRDLYQSTDTLTFIVKSVSFIEDVLLSRIEREYISCDTDLVINGRFYILNPHQCHLQCKRDCAV